MMLLVSASGPPFERYRTGQAIRRLFDVLVATLRLGSF